MYRYIIYTIPIAYEIGTTVIKYDKFGFLLGMGTAMLTPVYNYITKYRQNAPTEENLVREIKLLNKQLEELKNMGYVMIKREPTNELGFTHTVYHLENETL